MIARCLIRLICITRRDSDVICISNLNHLSQGHSAEGVSEPPNSEKNVIPTSNERSETDGQNPFKNRRNSQILIRETYQGIPTIRFANVGMTNYICSDDVLIPSCIQDAFNLMSNQVNVVVRASSLHI